MDCIGRMQDGVYNCYGEYDTSMCYECKYNADSEAEESEKKNNFASYKDRMEVLYQYLLGMKLPDGVHCKMPKLDCDVASSVIWFLQEIMHCLPSNIEQCNGCKELFDTDSEGYRLDDQYGLDGKTLPKKYWGSWCEGCVPDVNFELS